MLKYGHMGWRADWSFLKVWTPIFMDDNAPSWIKHRHRMMTSSNGNIFRVTGHLCEEFPTQLPVTRSFDVFFDLCLNKRLSRQSWGWWFETLSRPFWRHRNGYIMAWKRFPHSDPLGRNPVVTCGPPSQCTSNVAILGFIAISSLNKLLNGCGWFEKL